MKNNLIPTKYHLLVAQLFRFGIVGTIAALIHFSCVILLVQLFKFPPLLANVFGFISGFQVSYWGHRTWTFKANDTLHRIAIPKLLLVQTINLSLNELLFYILLSLNLPYAIALFIVLATFPIFTFLLSKLWVFKRSAETIG